MLLSFSAVLLFAMLPQVAAAGDATADVGEGPQPALNPTAWEFALKYEDPKRIEVSTPRGRETYWYVLYTVTNTSDRTQQFHPAFQIVTEDLKVFSTDVSVFPQVFETIRDLHKLQYPYLMSPSKAIGELRSGEDNARESVAIWREIDLTLNKFSVFVAGLSGEAQAVKNPAYDPNQKENAEIELSVPAGGGPAKASFPSNPKHFTLRKTLQIDYDLPGSAETRSFVEPRRTRVRWVMR